MPKSTSGGAGGSGTIAAGDRAGAAASARSFLGSNADVFMDIKNGETISGVKYPGVPGLLPERPHPRLAPRLLLTLAGRLGVEPQDQPVPGPARTSSGPPW